MQEQEKSIRPTTSVISTLEVRHSGSLSLQNKHVSFIIYRCDPSTPDDAQPGAACPLRPHRGPRRLRHHAGANVSRRPRILHPRPQLRDRQGLLARRSRRALQGPREGFLPERKFHLLPGKSSKCGKIKQGMDLREPADAMKAIEWGHFGFEERR